MTRNISPTHVVCLLGLCMCIGTIHGHDEVLPWTRNRERKLVCYYHPTGYFPASKVPGDACTHLIYAFGTITRAGPSIAPPSSAQASSWATLTSLRLRYPHLSILLSLQEDFNLVVGPDTTRMKTFAANAVAFLRKYQFDGVDMDWEYPKSSQKNYFSTFFQVMRDAVELDARANGNDPLLLSLALPNSQAVAQLSYDVPAIAKNVDFATAMTYDFHLYLENIDNRTGYNSPLYTTRGDNKYYSASAMAEYYLAQGLPGEKLLLGVPTYGRSWRLADRSKHGLHAPAAGKGSPGPYRHITGVYAYPDTCMALKNGAHSVRDTGLGAVYLYDGTGTWVAYDDVGTVKQKAQWAIENNLGGVGVWSMAIDDVDNVCGSGPLPLINTIKGVLLQESDVPVFQDTNRHMHYKIVRKDRIHNI